jgi:pyridoxal phosphate enzyme (YggS family)
MPSHDVRNRINENLAIIQERVAHACERAGRSTRDVTLVCVTKYAKLEWIQELVSLGVHDLGEARPQQLVLRAPQFPPEIRWHLIGHLQRNKAEDVLPVAHLIHSVDSLRLFDHISKSSQNLPRRPSILIEVNVSREPSKDGFRPEDLLSAWARMRTCESLEISGLMTMAPLGENAEAARPFFQKLQELRDRLRIESEGRWTLNDLSMGMSGDFEVGIEEGATIIRIGSRLFEGLAGDEG